MKTKIRFSTLVRDFGPVTVAKTMPDADWNKAVAEGRFATVYHAENDWCTPVLAVVKRHGCCNTICKIAFTKPLPADITEIIGMRNSNAAFQLVNELEPED